jgi:hypothetical protein
LNSCKNKDNIGLVLNSSGQVSGSLVDSATVNTNTVYDDKVFVTSSSSGFKTPLGYFIDPVFGTSEANLATDISLPLSYTAPTGTVTIDSALLVLQYADGFYGDSIASKYKVNVFQLKDKFDDATTYYNTTQWNLNGLIGSLSFTPRPHTKIKIFNIIKGKPDTLIKAAPQIRIPISTTFINASLFNAGTTALSSLANYQNLVKGMFITLDQSQTTGAGGIMMIKSDTLAVYYRNTSGSTVDTILLKIPISRFASQIKHTYSTTIQTELSDTISPKNTIYLQGLVGLRTKISFPNLLKNLRNNLLNQGSDIIINRAELVITPQPGSDIPYKPLPKLTMYKLDIAHQRTELQDANIGLDPRAMDVNTFSGYYSTLRKQYHFVITGYIQDLLFNKTPDYGTYIGVADTTNTKTVDTFPTFAVAARTVAGGGANKSSPVAIKLNIIYTKVAK